MTNYLTYLYLLTPLHTGGSTQEGNLMGIAREVHTEFPYFPASGVRGKIRSELESKYPEAADIFFGQKIKDGQQPTEGEVWFADATLLFFPIASLSHHLIWITCPMWLERWNRWQRNQSLKDLIAQFQNHLSHNKSAVVSFQTQKLYLQTALLKASDLQHFNFSKLLTVLTPVVQDNGLLTQLASKLVVVNDEDCIALVETGLPREVRVTLQETSKTVKGGSFRSEEAIPPETVLFFPWGMKPAKNNEATAEIRTEIVNLLKQRLQFGGLEGLGRGWADLRSVEIAKESK